MSITSTFEPNDASWMEYVENPIALWQPEQAFVSKKRPRSSDDPLLLLPPPWLPPPHEVPWRPINLPVLHFVDGSLPAPRREVLKRPQYEVLERAPTLRVAMFHPSAPLAPILAPPTRALAMGNRYTSVFKGAAVTIADARQVELPDWESKQYRASQDPEFKRRQQWASRQDWVDRGGHEHFSTTEYEDQEFGHIQDGYHPQGNAPHVSWAAEPTPITAPARGRDAPKVVVMPVRLSNPDDLFVQDPLQPRLSPARVEAQTQPSAQP